MGKKAAGAQSAAAAGMAGAGRGSGVAPAGQQRQVVALSVEGAAKWATHWQTGRGGLPKKARRGPGPPFDERHLPVSQSTTGSELVKVPVPVLPVPVSAGGSQVGVSHDDDGCGASSPHAGAGQ